MQQPISHKNCFACGNKHNNPDSLALNFIQTESGLVKAQINLGKTYQGYSGKLHGGIISTLLDAAMCHYLFYQQIEAMTADLQVRFLQPISINQDIEVSAHLDSVKRKIYLLNGQITYQGKLCASAKGKFMQLIK